MRLNGYNLICKVLNENTSKIRDVALEPFDKKFYLRQVPKEDQDMTSLGSPECIKYDIIIDIGEDQFVMAIAGFVGYLPAKKDPQIGFIQIFIFPKFRGQGILKMAEDLIAKEHNLKSLWATIDLDNVASIKSHLKAGFKYFSKAQIKKWNDLGLLRADKQTRLYKNYK
jgi:RimJ/RimL family protein N-acetyltransferase